MVKRIFRQGRRGIGIPFTALMMCAALFSGCSHDDDFTNDGDPVAVNFTAGIEAAGGMAYSAAPGTRNLTAPGTRTTGGGDEWTTTDHVGIFMLAAGGDITTASDRLADNVQYNVTNAATGALSPDGGMPIYYPQAGNVDFVAYYPYGTVTAGKYNVTVAGQTSETAQNALDVLYAKTTNVAKTKTAVGLQFSHVLSKITLNVTLGEGLTSLTGGDVTAATFCGMPASATLDLQDGTLTADAAEDFAALKTAANSGVNATFTALLIPQASGGGRTVDITVNGETYTGTIPDTDDFAAGQHYVYPVTVNKIGVTVDAVTITDWNTYDNGSGAAEKLDVVKIKAGTFLMGSSDGTNIGNGNGTGLNTTAEEPNRYTNETQHWVTLTKDFYMSKYPVTNAQYAAFLTAVKAGSDGRFTAANYPSGQYPDTELVRDCSQSGRSAWGVKWETDKWVPVDDAHKDHPVIYVTWVGAYEYAKWIGGALPTEAQWEYACRGGEVNKPFGVGDGMKLDYTLANFDWRSSWSWNGIDANADESATGSGSPGTTQAVGSYPANGYGLYDMHGNVYEWCLDQWDGSNNYLSLPDTDPVCSSGSIRVLRGGSWSGSARNCRSAYRINDYPASAFNFVGFRVVFVP